MAVKHWLTIANVMQSVKMVTITGMMLYNLRYRGLIDHSHCIIRSSYVIHQTSAYQHDVLLHYGNNCKAESDLIIPTSEKSTSTFINRNLADGFLTF